MFFLRTVPIKAVPRVPAGKLPVLLVLPSPEADNILPDSSVSATIDTRSGLTLENLNLKITVQGQVVPGRVERDPLHSVITLTPVKPLHSHSLYQIQLEHLQKVGGRYKIVPIFSWKFTTGSAMLKPEPADIKSEVSTQVTLPPPLHDKEEKAPVDTSRIARKITELLRKRRKQRPQPSITEYEEPGSPESSVPSPPVEILPSRIQVPVKPETFPEPELQPEDDIVTKNIRRLAEIINKRKNQHPLSSTSLSQADPTRAKRTAYWVPGIIVAKDVLDIRVWNHPELTGEYNISPSGYLGFPLVGELKVTGKSVDEVKNILTERLAYDYIKDPFLTIYHRRGQRVRINILGKINRPGIFTFKEPPTLLEAIAAAGGTAASGKQEVSVVQLVRNSVKEDIDLHRILIDGKFEDNVFLEDRDILILKQQLIKERIYVFGGLLKEQGIFRYEEGMTVMDAILLAGGGSTPPEIYDQFKPGLKYTQVVRGNLDKPEIKKVNMERVLFRGDLSQNIALKPGDIVIVPTKRVMDIWAWVNRLQPLLQTIISGNTVLKILDGSIVR